MTARDLLPLTADGWDIGERTCWELVVLPELCRRRLRPRSIKAYFYTYSTWLRYIRKIERTGRPKPPLSVSDSDLVRRFIDELRARTSLITAYIEAERLRRLFIAFDLGSNTEFLASMVRTLRREIKGQNRPSNLLVDTNTLVAIGSSLICAGEGVISAIGNCRHGALLWRDGFMIKLLALRPLRIHNFGQLMLRKHITMCDGMVWIRLSGNETKNGKTFEVPLPNELTREFNHYISAIRPIFEADASVRGFLWISRRGLPMSDATLRRIIKTRTAAALGFPVSPHKFRHAAVTFLAMHYPGSISVASDLLGHSHSAVTEAYYNLIGPQQAATIIQDNLIDRARRGGKEGNLGVKAALPSPTSAVSI